jgi:hypothetical protein
MRRLLLEDGRAQFFDSVEDGIAAHRAQMGLSYGG